MEINLPGLVNATAPKDGGKRNVRVLSNNLPNHNDPGFLSSDFPKSPPKLYISAETDDFDELTLSEWKDEGFNVEYLPMGQGGKEYVLKLKSLSKSDLGPCETYGIIAYGDAASVCLEHFHVLDNNPEFKLGCLIAYYPTRIPDPQGHYPSSIQVLVHLAGSDVGVVKQSQMVGIQGKKRLSRKKIDQGLGVGGKGKLAYPSYTYESEPGFAEQDLDEYDRVSAELAWSRSLATARRAFRMDLDLEEIIEKNVQGKFFTRDLQKTLSTYVDHKIPHVTHMPTLKGGIGKEELQRFYSDYFLNSNPPSMKLTLLSRTIGTDRVVDELHMFFKHTQEMPWILPGLPPTNKRVEILIISIVTLRGGKLYHEHIYWDQASVLVQIGLLDPKLVPNKAKSRGVTKLPVVGKEAARRALEGVYEDVEGEVIQDWDQGSPPDSPPPEQETIGPTKNGSENQNTEQKGKHQATVEEGEEEE